jgi:homoserine dehydrogenase
MNTAPTLRIALAGFGTVGSGVVRLLQESADELARRTNCRIILKTIADLDLDKVRRAQLPPDVSLTTDAFSLAEDPSLDVVVELMGGLGAAKTLIEKTLGNGRQVVTANKALLAHAGTELFPLAHANGTLIRYEASVGGGIPVVQTLRESLAANRILSIMGILNGTANYILSEMSGKGSNFAEALAGAQAAGYAEADPTLDIDGHDTAHKLILLVRLAWGLDYPYESMLIRGIRSVQGIDIELAREFGYRLKLLGQAKLIDGRLEAFVYPTMIKYHAYLLARVEEAYNAIHIVGNGVGPLFLHGLGAGSLPTASAVLGDIAAAARDKVNGIRPVFAPMPPSALTPGIAPPELAQTPWYLRFTVRDRPGVLRDLAGALARENVSIAQAIQKSLLPTGVPLVFKTHEASGQAIERAVKSMENDSLLLAPAVCYKILE